jgi:hypothetical protein
MKQEARERQERHERHEREQKGKREARERQESVYLRLCEKKKNSPLLELLMNSRY